jgi:protein farnesyltransferase/geranylgeranyltransferase type-1 subunit alpha
MYQVDGKNYHAWAHRQWAILTYGLVEGELQYTSILIESGININIHSFPRLFLFVLIVLQNSDPFNNSAWNHRWFIVHISGHVSIETLTSEVEYCFENIEKAPKNDSVWNYMRGIYRKHADIRELIEPRCNELKTRFENASPFIPCPLLYSLIADIR